MMPKEPLARAGVVFTLSLVLTVATYFGALENFDHAAGKVLDSNCAACYSPDMPLLDKFIFSFYGVILMLGCLSVYAAPRGSRLQYAMITAGILMIMTLLEAAGKLALPQPAADGGFSEQSHFGILLPHTYPSGHAIRLTYLAVLIWPYLRRASKACAALLLGILLSSLVATGAHFASDVLIGACIGLAGGLLQQFLTRRIPRKERVSA